MTHKILKCIPNLLANGATAQAATMINVVKASFDISQEYKSTVCNLPQHFVTHMNDLYRDAMYFVSECAMVGSDKDKAINDAEREFIEASEKVTKVLDNKAKILESLRSDLSKEYDKVAEQNKPTVLERSMSIATASNETINKMIEYVKKLKPEERLAMIYALGISTYVDNNSITTASTEQIASEDIETISSNFGIYSISDIYNKTKQFMLSHNFKDESIEYDSLYNVVENISDKSIEEICAEINKKLQVNTNDVKDIDKLLDILDEAGESITKMLELPASILFIIKEDNIYMICAFNKEGANSLISTADIDEDADKYKELFFSTIDMKKLKEIAVDQEVDQEVDFSTKEKAANDVWELVFEMDYKDNKHEFINLIRDYGIEKNTESIEENKIEPDCSKTVNEICDKIIKLLRDTCKESVSLRKIKASYENEENNGGWVEITTNDIKIEDIFKLLNIVRIAKSPSAGGPGPFSRIYTINFPVELPTGYRIDYMRIEDDFGTLYVNYDISKLK